MALAAKIKDSIVYSPYPDIQSPDGVSIYKYIEERLLQHGERTAIIDGDSRTTFKDVLRGIQRYAVGFRSRGIELGDRVCVHASNSTQAIMAMYAIVAAGGAVVLAKPTLTERELLYQVQDSGASYIVADASHAKKVQHVHQTLKLKGLFSLGKAEGFYPVSKFGSLSYTSFRECEVADPKTTRAVITYTSGTTGLPKGAIIAHYCLLASLEALRCAKQFTEEDVVLAWNPITHISGFLFAITQLCLGSTGVVCSASPTADEFVDTIRKNNVNTLYVFPTAFQKYVLHMEALGTQLPSVKKMVICGTVATEAFVQKILKVFHLDSLQNGYGLSEAAGVVAITPIGRRMYRTVGHPAPSCKFKIVDVETRKVLGPGEQGEILYQGPNLMVGYLNRPDATAEAFEDGWLRTGDLGYYDGSGQLYVLERIKDMIKCMDNQLAPAEVEDLLLTNTAVAEVAVVGVPHPEYGEAPTAFVVLKDSAHRCKDAIADELKNLVKGQLARYKHLHGGVAFVDAIPKTDTGKFQRRQLRLLDVKKR